MILMFILDPGFGTGFLSIPDPGPVSRILGSKKHKNPDPDPQHWYRYLTFSQYPGKCLELLCNSIKRERSTTAARFTTN